MSTTVTCPSCHRTFRVGDRFAGRRGRCPDCHAVVTVPDEELAQLDLLPDEPAPVDYHRRRDPPRRPSPRDHLPAWRRVSIGFLVQQGAAVLLLVGLMLLMLGTVALADDPGDFQKEPDTAQMVTASLGMLALFVGSAVQAVGRLISASTPVRAPRVLGILSAVGSILALLGGCLVGFFLVAAGLEEQQGNGGDEALATLGGLALFGWMFLVAASETVHGFAVGSIGRVLRADGARVLGNGLGVFVALAGLLAIFVFCGLAAWVGNNNPQNPDPDPDPDQARALLVWLVGAAALTGLYLMLDVALLQAGRSAVARVAADAADGAGPDDRWD
jgi:MFS family permease